jgi:hypothetical protein
MLWFCLLVSLVPQSLPSLPSLESLLSLQWKSLPRLGILANRIKDLRRIHLRVPVVSCTQLTFK